eukprot:TRINITY_DN1408_c0_g2_i1.p1 TRINITY_DN1408_c0_g2~~TRINITY_DN1408_c0_g2_i1.p1  ORF type:complete len:369 (-),score=86.36 TRINITY_DN1408_c0_g2_i1:65-1171(-)
MQSDTETLGNTLNKDWDQNQDRCVGALLSAVIGDALGAATEGHYASQIIKEYPNGVKDYVQCAHMGVPTDPFRKGMYTDDSQTSLALASSLVECTGLNPLHAARSYADFYNTRPIRGYPNTAQMVLQHVLRRTTSILKTGTIAMKDGSYANGGAMRISPIGIAFRNATNDELKEAARMAILSSHVHPESIEGAFIQARAISWLIKKDPEIFDPQEFLRELESLCELEVMQNKFKVLRQLLTEVEEDPTITDYSLLKRLTRESFQIRTSDALSCSFWAFVRRFKNPEEALMGAISLGGDTDTIASLTGACLGALHGTSWIPMRWYSGLENEEKGRDFCVQTGSKLSQLDLHDVLPFDESIPSEPPLRIR